MFHRSTPLVPIRGVHLDLKGLPPTPTRLLDLLDLFAAARFNCVLVEWEDSFPWDVDRRFRSPTAYAPAVVEQFHRRANELGLGVIPLVQCLGHAETPLQFEEYRHLRELPDRCDGFNPLASGARELVARMIDDVLRFAGPITHFHLGGDEAFTFGRHADTRAYIAKHGKAELYLHHVEPLLDMLLARNIRPILWHDMMHDWDTAALVRLGEKADLMFWSYHGHPDAAPALHNTALLAHFRTAGIRLWGAGAFKGADSPGDGELPDLARRIENALGWADVAHRFDMSGVVGTGWSRYSTHRMQCEPIDGALAAMLQFAGILHYGVAATNDQCLAALDSISERARFETAHSALKTFAAARRGAWQCIWVAHAQQVLQRSNLRRRGSGVLEELHRLMRDSLEQLQRHGDAVQNALAQSVDPLSLDSFIRERIVPLTSVADAISHLQSPV